MAWVYRCNVEYLDPNDLLEKGFNATVTSSVRLSTVLAVNALTQRAYSLILRFKVTPPVEGLSQADYEIELGPCTEAEI